MRRAGRLRRGDAEIYYEVAGEGPALVFAHEQPALAQLYWQISEMVFPPAAGPAFARLAPRGSAVIVPAAGHSVYFERAAQFNELIGRIL